MSRSRFAIVALLYALLVAYASTFVGVTGPHFVPLDPSEALRRLTDLPLVANGSDQRSDWMGNLLMLVPLGFLVTGWLSPATRRSGAAGFAAFALCLLFILTVKYAQLFFPPRTVTLNYVIAQCLGTAAGILAFGVLREPLARLGNAMTNLESLRLVLRIYTALVILFMLMPLDFALSPDDLAAQLSRLPDTLTAISGDGRPVVVRVAVIAGGMMSTIPIGAMLTIVGRDRAYVGRGVRDATWIGFCAMAAVYAASCLILSASPSLAAVGFRSAGIVLGAWAMHALTWREPDRIKRDLAGLVPWAVPIYLLLLAAVNGLLSLDWNTPSQAADAFYPYGLIPLFNYYIVTKAQAAKNIIAHTVMYAPVGVMIWLRAKDDGGKVAAFLLAALLSAIVEAGRFLRPELVPDINAIPLAGAAAWATLMAMHLLWQTLPTIAQDGPGEMFLPPRPLQRPFDTPVLGWRDRTSARRAHPRDQGTAIGDIEDY